jgi:hypothetical protein
MVTYVILYYLLVDILFDNICFQWNDKSWKKSNSRYIMTSYFQPLLLWTGVMLICRYLYRSASIFRWKFAKSYRYTPLHKLFQVFRSTSPTIRNTSGYKAKAVEFRQIFFNCVYTCLLFFKVNLILYRIMSTVVSILTILLISCTVTR